jgi:hypothetical protein
MTVHHPNRWEIAVNGGWHPGLRLAAGYPELVFLVQQKAGLSPAFVPCQSEQSVQPPPPFKPVEPGPLPVLS